jgi:hypothetical protein
MAGGALAVTVALCIDPIASSWAKANGATEVDPIGWTKKRPSLDGYGGGLTGGGRETAIHSGLDSALGSHPCVALSSYQAFPLYGKLR